MIRFSFVVVGTFIALGIVSAATCPFDIPVVTFAPHQVAGFSWGPVIRPMGDACISRIAVDPANGLDWFVGGANGLYVTRNSGQTWMKPLIGSVRALLLVPGVPALVYVGIGPYLYLSRDSGASWNVIFDGSSRDCGESGFRMYFAGRASWPPKRPQGAKRALSERMEKLGAWPGNV